MPKIVDRKHKSEELIQAALNVFSQKGYSATKMIDIARAANVGKGTIYEYFPSKEELFLATFRYLYQQYDKSFQERFLQTKNPIDQLRLAVQIYFVEFLENNWQFMHIVMDYWLAAARNLKEQSQTFNLAELYSNYRQLTSQILQAGIDQKLFRPVNSEYYASMLLAILDGLYLQLFLDQNFFEIRAMADSVLDLFIKSLTNFDED